MSNETLPKAWARAKALGESCAYGNGNGEGEGIGRHMNTAVVVRDIVAIVEAFGEWREGEVRRFLDSKVRKRMMKEDIGSEASSREGILERTKWIPGKEKLLFWDSSYGTLIGQMFASMYPEKVHRIILDGIHVPGDPKSSIEDADKVLDRLLLHCYESGLSENCALFDSNGPEHIKKKLSSVLEDVKRNPVAVSATRETGPQIITFEDIDSHLHMALYFPMTAQILFQALHNLTLGDASWFADKKYGSTQPSPYLPEHCRTTPKWTPECQGPNDSTAGYGIECTDGAGFGNWTVEDFRVYWEALRGVSEIMAGRRAMDRLSCMHWTLRAAWKFDGMLTLLRIEPNNKI